MIQGIGIDLAATGRFASWVEKPSKMERFFSAREVEQILSRGAGAAESLAARFAAKEALGKALGTGTGPLPLREIEVLTPPEGGAPRIEAGQPVQILLKEKQVNHIFVSLTHEKEYAAAVVVLEGA